MSYPDKPSILELFYFKILYFWELILNGILGKQIPKASFVAETNLPTDKGIYRVRSYRSNIDPNFEPTAIIFWKSGKLGKCCCKSS